MKWAYSAMVIKRPVPTVWEPVYWLWLSINVSWGSTFCKKSQVGRIWSISQIPYMDKVICFFFFDFILADLFVVVSQSFSFFRDLFFDFIWWPYLMCYCSIIDIYKSSRLRADWLVICMEANVLLPLFAFRSLKFNI